MSDNPSDRTRDNSEPWQWGLDENNCIEAARMTTSRAKLRQMAQDILSGTVLDDGTIAEALIENQRLHFEVACRLSEHWFGEIDFGYQICCRPDATAYALDAWSDHWDVMVIDTIANHPNTSLATLLNMSKSENPQTVMSAFNSGRLPDEYVDSCAQSESVCTREAVATATGNPNILKILAADNDSGVRRCAVSNCNINQADLAERALIEDNAKVVAAMCKRLSDPEVIRRTCSKWWAKPRNDDTHTIEAALLQNEHTPDEIRITILI